MCKTFVMPRESRPPASRESLPAVHRTLGALLRRPYEEMADRLYAELAERGFPDARVAHSAVFRTISPGGSRVTELAARAGMAKQSMAYLVEQMQALGYVEVLPDPDDRRAKRVRLTARGEALVREAVRLSAQHERRYAMLIGQERVSELRAILEALDRALGSEA